MAQARDFTLVLGADGRLWARGLNTRGQLGVGIAQTVVADFLPLPAGNIRPWRLVARTRWPSTVMATSGSGVTTATASWAMARPATPRRIAPSG